MKREIQQCLKTLIKIIYKSEKYLKRKKSDLFPRKLIAEILSKKNKQTLSYILFRRRGTAGVTVGFKAFMSSINSRISPRKKPTLPPFMYKVTQNFIKNNQKKLIKSNFNSRLRNSQIYTIKMSFKKLFFRMRTPHPLFLLSSFHYFIQLHILIVNRKNYNQHFK